MPRNAEILKELAEISPAVANLDPSLPYQVPTGYFERLADQILSIVRLFPDRCQTSFCLVIVME